MKLVTKIYHRSQRDDWETPPDLFAELHREFNFTIDAAASKENAKLPRFWTAEDDALKQNWSGERVWCNPPYSLAGKFIEKAHDEQMSISGPVLICFLLAARTDTKAWHSHIHGRAEIRFLKGRIRFVGAEHPAPFPSALVIWRSS